jgi:hypothetical protein
MKQIKFKPRMTVEHKQRIMAVAYATQKVGGWQSTNVTPDVIEWLSKDGFNVDIGAQPSTKRLNVINAFSEAMSWLADHGYAARVVKAHRTTEFVMDPEVQVPMPDYVKGKQFKQGKMFTPEQALESQRRPPKAPPLPERGPDLDRFKVMFRIWWNEDRQEAESWLTDVCDKLERR